VLHWLSRYYHVAASRTLIWLLCVVASVIAGACGSAAKNTGSTGPTNIITATSVGAVHIGDRRSTVEQILGKGVIIKRLRGHLGAQLVDETLVGYAKDELRIAYLSRHHQSIVFGIEVFSPRYVAAGGVRVDEEFSPAAANESGYRCLTKDTDGISECVRRNVVLPGIVVRVKNSRVTSLAVFASSIEQLS